MIGETVTLVVMEATGDYWKPFVSLLEDGPFEVMLVNPRHVKNLPGRKTDGATVGTAPLLDGAELVAVLVVDRVPHLLDHLALRPEHIAEAIYLPPLPAGSRIIDALLAAVADKVADDAGLPRPSWTALAPVLDEPYEPLVRRGVQLEVPEQLAERGLMIDTESLWRGRSTVGV